MSVLQMVTSGSHPGSGNSLDPSSMIPQLTSQMGQLQLSNTSPYLPAHYTQMYQTSPQGTLLQPVGVPIEEHSLVEDRSHHHHHYPTYPSLPK
ncbi:hypothetical protein PoB_006350200 [Plakobranchus ocellatus]|uniref:Uncharacterized protein n=1 Tax=Plakobranchus ocellatus TaxID=259542 RepID=A0AAV4CYH6_9GAST|nr:hypothetical protein PoB_006350200 [Plakobranchus ocellatus]